MNTSISIIVDCFLFYLAYLGISIFAVALLFVLGPRCYICGARYKKYKVSETSEPNPEDGQYEVRAVVRYHELTRCIQCRKRICHKHLHFETGYCSNCVPDWIRRIDKMEERERVQQFKERQEMEAARERLEKSIRYEKEQQAKAAQLKEQRELEEQRRCHVCGNPGNIDSKICVRCNEWTCDKDIYHGICKKCAQTL